MVKLIIREVFTLKVMELQQLITYTFHYFIYEMANTVAEMMTKSKDKPKEFFYKLHEKTHSISAKTYNERITFLHFDHDTKTLDFI